MKHTRRAAALLALASVVAMMAVMPARAGDENIAGAVVPTGGETIRDSLDSVSDTDDVFKVALNGDDTVSLKLTGPPGTDFDLYLYSPSAKDIWRSTEVAWSENPGTSNETISYDVPSTGTYYVDVATWDSVGTYTLTITSPSRLSITSNKSVVTYPETVKLTGSISPAHSGATVSLLERRADTGSFATAASTSAGTAGAFEFTVTPREATYYKVSWPGDVDHESAESGTTSVAVRPAVGLSTNVSQISLGNSFTLSGRVSPNHAGKRMTISRKLSRGWSRAAYVYLDTSSRFSWTVKPSSTGTYDMRTSFDGDDDHESNTSSTVRITVVSAPQS